MEFLTPIKGKNRVEPADLHVRAAQITSIARLGFGKQLVVFVDPVRRIKKESTELSVSFAAQLLEKLHPQTQHLLPISITTGCAGSDQQRLEASGKIERDRNSDGATGRMSAIMRRLYSCIVHDCD